MHGPIRAEDACKEPGTRYFEKYRFGLSMNRSRAPSVKIRSRWLFTKNPGCAMHSGFFVEREYLNSHYIAYLLRASFFSIEIL